MPAWTIPQGTTPAAPDAPSAAWEDVTLLLHMDGSNGSIVFTDSSSHARTISRYSGATIRTAISKFGGASGEFSGYSTGHITAPASNDWSAAQDFTIEMWVYAGWNFRKEHLASTVDSATLSNAWNLYKAASGAIGFEWWDSSGTIASAESSAALTVESWAHVAATVSGTTVRIYINGSMDSETDFVIRPSIAARTLYIGRRFATDNAYFYGNLDDLRFITGFALYTAPSFDVPAAAHPDGSV